MTTSSPGPISKARSDNAIASVLPHLVHVVAHVFAIIRQGPRQAFTKGHLRRPAGGPLEPAGIGIKTADINRLLICRPFDESVSAASGELHQNLDEVAVGHVLVAAHVERVAVAGVGRARTQERIDGVVDVDEIADLRSVAEHLELSIFEDETNEPGEKALSIVPNQLTRAVDVRQTQRARADAEHVVVDEVIVLTGRLVDSVHIGGAYEMLLGHRQELGLSIDLARAREDDFGDRIVMPAGFEERQLAVAIDLEIRVGISNAVDVAHLPGHVEDDFAIAHQIVHRAGLTDISDVDPHAIFDAGNVEQVAAVIGNERVDQENICAKLDEPAGEITADESEPARDHHAPAAVKIWIHAAMVSLRAFKWSLRITSDHQSRSTSTAVR